MQNGSREFRKGDLVVCTKESVTPNVTKPHSIVYGRILEVIGSRSSTYPICCKAICKDQVIMDDFLPSELTLLRRVDER